MGAAALLAQNPKPDDDAISGAIETIRAVLKSEQQP